MIILFPQYPREKKLCLEPKFLKPKQKHKSSCEDIQRKKCDDQTYLGHQALPCICLHERLLTNFIKSSLYKQDKNLIHYGRVKYNVSLQVLN